MSGARGTEVEVCREERSEEKGFPLMVNLSWEESFPGLAAGITAAGEGAGGEPADFGLTTAGTPWAWFRRFEALGDQLGFPAAAVGRQVHGDAVTCLSPAPEPGLRVPGETDGLVTSATGLLLTVTAADCVPVYVVDPASGGLGLLHAGWRGTASGVLESGLRAMRARFGADPARVHLHLGPAICGECYEVGPEVPDALGLDAERPAATQEGRTTVDLRSELVARALALGVPRERISRSPWCTRCGPDHFHSYRGKGESDGRMAAYLGWRRRGGG